MAKVSKQAVYYLEITPFMNINRYIEMLKKIVSWKHFIPKLVNNWWLQEASASGSCALVFAVGAALLDPLSPGHSQVLSSLLPASPLMVSAAPGARGYCCILSLFHLFFPCPSWWWGTCCSWRQMGYTWFALNLWMIRWDLITEARTCPPSTPPPALPARIRESKGFLGL